VIKRLSLATPYLTYGFVTGAWVPLATVDRTTFETISVGVAWPLGGLLAVALLRHLTTSTRIAACALVGAVFATSILIANGPLLTLAAIAVSITSQAFFGLTRSNTPVSKLVGLGPFTMVGGLLGVSIFSFVDTWAVALPLISFAYFSRTEAAKECPRGQHRSWPITRSATLIALIVSAAAWGFIPLAATITEQEAGRTWIIPQMAAYAAGSLFAGPLNKRLPNIPITLGGLMFVAGASWLAALTIAGPGITAARFISGAALFVVQGKVETVATKSGSDSQPDNLAAVKASLSVGAAFSGFWVGLAAQNDLTSTAWLSTAVGAAACITLTIIILNSDNSTSDLN